MLTGNNVRSYLSYDIPLGATLYPRINRFIVSHFFYGEYKQKILINIC